MPENLPDLRREIEELSARVAALRRTHAMYPDDAAGTAEAALAELGHAERLLTDCGAGVSSGTPSTGADVSRGVGGDDERALLRSVFAGLGVPVVLLDRDGNIRRVNPLAADRLGSAIGYLTGKPFSTFVDLRRRAAMRSWLAAVLRGGGPASFESRLAQRGWAEDVHLTLTRLEVPTEADPLVLVVMSPSPGGDDPGPAPLEPEVEDQVVVLAARRLDVLTRMTRLLLLSAGPGGAGQPLADDAASLLADSYADWVIVDVCDLPTDASRARRASVASPREGGHRDLVESLDPLGSEVPRDVLTTGNSVLNQLIEDEGTLGRDGGGTPVLGVLEAGSLMCVPLRGSRGVRGALTLIRRSNRASFRLADLGLIEEIGEHIGLALPPRPTG